MTVRSAQRPVPLLRIDALAEEAAGVVRQVFPGALKRLATVPGFHTTAVSRARQGCRTNPLFRLALWVLAARRAGMPRARALLLVDWLGGLVDSLWSDDGLSISEAALREQQCESEETAVQVAYLAGDASVRQRWLSALRAERAAEAELIAALEAEERAGRRAA